LFEALRRRRDGRRNWGHGIMAGTAFITEEQED
jgi:hypothetical protein